MRAGSRSRTAAALLLTGALLGGLAAAAPSAAVPRAQAPADAAGDAVQEFGACLTARKQGDLLLLLDQSASLQDTDPDDVRVQAAQFLLTQFQTTSEEVEADLQVAVAGFDRDYEVTAEWQGLDAASLPGLVRGLEDYRERDDGFDTDYVHAVSGATEELRERQRSDGSRCQVLVWFSDGQYSVEPRNSDREVERYGTTKDYAPGVELRSTEDAAAVMRAGVESLCRTGGLADQLRAGGPLTFAVGLGADVDYSLMRRIATGTAPDAPPCGAPTTRPVGDFRLAEDVTDLLFAINGYSGLVAPTDQPSGVCPREACSQQSRAFVLDASIRTVDVLAGASEAGIDVLLRGPGGAPPTRFSYSETGPLPEQVVAGQAVTGAWLSDRLLQLDIRRSGPGWDGQWQLVFVDPTGTAPGARARTQIRITGDLVPRRLDEQPLRTVPDNRLALGIASEETGQAVDPAQVLGTASLSATLIAADGEELPLAVDQPLSVAAQGVPADLSAVTPGPATLRLELAVQTRGTTVAGVAVPGTQLAVRPVTLSVDVLPPPDYPPIGEQVEFGRHEGIGPHAGSLAVTGPGCVWLAGETVETGPAGAAVEITSPHDSADTCLAVPDGEEQALELALSLDEAGNGSVTGLLDLRLAPLDAPDRAVAAAVPFRGDVVRPVKEPVLYGVLALALVLGLALPLAFLYLVKHLTAKIPDKGLRAGSVTVALVGREVQRSGAALTLSLADTRFVPVEPGGVRALDVEGLSLRTRTGASPTAAAHTLVTAAGQVRTSEGNDRLPVAVHGNWVAVLAPDLTTARLVVLLPADATAPSYERMARDVRERLPRMVQELRDDGGAPPAAPDDGRWGGAPTPPSPGGGGWGGGAPRPPAGGGGWGGTPAAPSSGGAAWGAPAPPSSSSSPSSSSPSSSSPAPPASGGAWTAPPGGRPGPPSSP